MDFFSNSTTVKLMVIFEKSALYYTGAYKNLKCIFEGKFLKNCTL